MTPSPADPEHRALLAGVRAAPRDDAPRLVLADWYEERGLAELAAFVRWGCANRRAVCRRGPGGVVCPYPDARWFEGHSAAVCASARPAARRHPDWGWWWHRGFVARLEMPADAALDRLGPLLEAWPITTVRLTAPLSAANADVMRARARAGPAGTGGRRRWDHVLNLVYPTVRFREFYGRGPRDACGRFAGHPLDTRFAEALGRRVPAEIELWALGGNPVAAGVPGAPSTRTAPRHSGPPRSRRR